MVSRCACHADTAVSAATGAQTSRSAGDREATFSPVPRTMNRVTADKSRRRTMGGPVRAVMTIAATPYAAAATALAERYVAGRRPGCRPPYESLPQAGPDARQQRALSPRADSRRPAARHWHERAILGYPA